MKFNELKRLAENHRKEDIADTIEAICEATGETELYDHLEHVEAIAIDIAENYRLDPERLHIGSYLHDIAKLIDYEEYLPILEKYGVAVCDEEIQVRVTLHAKVSMVIAREIFEIKDALLLDAISNHTTLRVKATEYEKVLFLADKMTWNEEDLIYLLDETIMQVLNVTCFNALEWIIRDVKRQGGTVLSQVYDAYEYFKNLILF